MDERRSFDGKADDFDLPVDEKFVGQHYAYFETPEVAEKVAGSNKPIRALFDNHTDFKNDKTRVGVEKVYDPSAQKTVMPMHWATHCGSVDRQAKDSMVIGWGLNFTYGNIPTLPLVPTCTEIDPQTRVE